MKDYNKIYMIPCLISTGQISSKGCVRENTIGKFISFFNCNLFPSNDVYLKLIKIHIILLIFIFQFQCINFLKNKKQTLFLI